MADSPIVLIAVSAAVAAGYWFVKRYIPSEYGRWLLFIVAGVVTNHMLGVIDSTTFWKAFTSVLSAFLVVLSLDSVFGSEKKTVVDGFIHMFNQELNRFRER